MRNLSIAAFMLCSSLALALPGQEKEPSANPAGGKVVDLALERGIEWLAKNQGAEGNWESNDLGLVSMGTNTQHIFQVGNSSASLLVEQLRKMRHSCLPMSPPHTSTPKMRKKSCIYFVM